MSKGESTEQTTSQRTPLWQTDLSHFDVRSGRGFLPANDPPRFLPAAFEAWEHAASELPKLMMTDRVRSILEELPLLGVDQLTTIPDRERAMMVLSFLSHGYVWGEANAAQILPKNLALPWYQLAQLLGRPPVLSYASYALWNWQRIDPNAEVALGNIALLQNFFAGMDEEWFILVHVDIEQRAAAGLWEISYLLKAAYDGELGDLERSLKVLHKSLLAVNASMARMPEHCDPYIYYNRVRPCIHGWKDCPALPRGLIYEGVDAWGGEPQQFRGETGAQSSIVPALDAVLGITHKDDPLRHYLNEMRDYMPPRHRQFVEAIESHTPVRTVIQREATAQPKLTDIYNQCVTELSKFRSTHLEFAGSYIESQTQTSENNPTQVGTGGTPFMTYLAKHRDETEQHLL